MFVCFYPPKHVFLPGMTKTLSSSIDTDTLSQFQLRHISNNRVLRLFKTSMDAKYSLLINVPAFFFLIIFGSAVFLADVHFSENLFAL